MTEVMPGPLLHRLLAPGREPAMIRRTARGRTRGDIDGRDRFPTYRRGVPARGAVPGHAHGHEPGLFADAGAHAPQPGGWRADVRRRPVLRATARSPALGGDAALLAA